MGLKKDGSLPHNNLALHYHVPINMQKLFWMETLKKYEFWHVTPQRSVPFWGDCPYRKVDPKIDPARTISFLFLWGRYAPHLMDEWKNKDTDWQRHLLSCSSQLKIKEMLYLQHGIVSSCSYISYFSSIFRSGHWNFVN